MKSWFYTVGTVLSLNHSARDGDGISVYCSQLGRESKVSLRAQEDGDGESNESKLELFMNGVNDELLLPKNWEWQGRGALHITWKSSDSSEEKIQKLQMLSCVPIVIIPTNTVPIDYAMFLVSPFHKNFDGVRGDIAAEEVDGFAWAEEEDEEGVETWLMVTDANGVYRRVAQMKPTRVNSVVVQKLMTIFIEESKVKPQAWLAKKQQHRQYSVVHKHPGMLFGQDTMPQYMEKCKIIPSRNCHMLRLWLSYREREAQHCQVYPKMIGYTPPAKKKTTNVQAEQNWKHHMAKLGPPLHRLRFSRYAISAVPLGALARVKPGSGISAAVVALVPCCGCWCWVNPPEPTDFQRFPVRLGVLVLMFSFSFYCASFCLFPCFLCHLCRRHSLYLLSVLPSFV
eukprot:Skav206037  [mRNA]  locus=scaffold1314:478998:485912:+ [translate_table: standard]